MWRTSQSHSLASIPRGTTGSQKKDWGAYRPTLEAPGPVQVASAESGGVDLALLRSGLRGRSRHRGGVSSSRGGQAAPHRGHAAEGPSANSGSGIDDDKTGAGKVKAPEKAMSTKKKQAFTRALEGYL